MEANEFKTTVLPIRSRLLKYAWHLTENQEDAEDAVQEVMLKLWNSRHELDYCRNIEAFAKTLTHHTCIDLIRRKKHELFGKDSEQMEMLSHLPEHLYEIKDEIRLIREIIATLPPLQHDIMHMKDIEEYETEEIAQITGCSTEAIRQNLSRARKRVRDTYLAIIRKRNINK